MSTPSLVQPTERSARPLGGIAVGIAPWWMPTAVHEALSR